jgi:hypothetical protein
MFQLPVLYLFHSCVRLLTYRRVKTKEMFLDTVQIVNSDGRATLVFLVENC